eukprot:CAMPEP_0201681538 /NCGR_PEP_ID=MMETSP0494-20130426/51164_1 /ASSEMBLY_ACC=CAM_ASM_000839 /TAXON_ID=420259 /ORGANISM="Thalassiosira gravida, Strain GMp14c1" /LENGTH=424 /DNA_ID=CAMNT_0048165289 /DNA_START=127 /DNA_END=1401 /DNA_ORIENTATION=+
MADPTKTNETTKSSTSMMPMWVTDSQIDPSWVQEKLSDFDHVPECCVVKDISNDTRKGDVPKNGATLLLQLTSREQDGNDGDHTGFGTKTAKAATTTTLVVKQVPTTRTRLAMSRQLGLAREAIFYNQLAPKIIKISSSSNNTDSDEACILPTIHFSYGDMYDGSKVIIMEDLSKGFVDSGILFGPGNPNNWNRDLKRQINGAYPPPRSGSTTTVPTSFEVANQTFLAIANVHATFWRDEALLLNSTEEEYGGSSWLRGSAWICEEDEESWRASQGMIQKIWEKYTNSYSGESESESSIRWDPLVRQIVEKAMKGISWESQKERLNVNSNFCLVHGDFWPGNVMISTDHHATSTSTEGNGGVRDLRLLDWEMVGEPKVLHTAENLVRIAVIASLFNAHFGPLHKRHLPYTDKLSYIRIFEHSDK